MAKKQYSDSATNGRDTFKGEGYMVGNDAAYIKPKLIPDYELLGRDDSGGPDYQPYTAEFGDGGFVHGEKAHLSAHGGSDDSLIGDEQDSMEPMRQSSKSVAVNAPASSKKNARL